MYIYIWAYTHTYRQAYIDHGHIYIHTYWHTHIHIARPTHGQPYIQPDKPSCRQAYLHTGIYI